MHKSVFVQVLQKVQNTHENAFMPLVLIVVLPQMHVRTNVDKNNFDLLIAIYGRICIHPITNLSDLYVLFVWKVHTKQDLVLK